MRSESRLANDAWEAYFRAQATLARELAESDIWDGLLTKEYAVLHALSTRPEGLRISELCDDVLLTQPGMSRLIGRLEARGMIARQDDAADARARRISLTPAGAQAQRRVGRKLAQHIAQMMTRALSPTQLDTLRELSITLLTAATGPAAAVQQQALERMHS